MDNFKSMHKIAQGAYGTVYYAIQKTTGKPVAIKKMALRESGNGILYSFLREATALRRLEHENVVRLYDVFHHKSKAHLVFEYIEKDLKQLIDMHPPTVGLPPPLIRSYFWQMLCGTDYCHSSGIIHRDLKPDNLLIDSFGNLKIADFGLARNLQASKAKLSPEVVTIGYKAPEILLYDPNYRYAVDIWSLACIFIEMRSHVVIFDGDTNWIQLEKIFRVLGTPREQSWPGFSYLPGWIQGYPTYPGVEISSVLPILRGDRRANALIKTMMVYNPFLRPTAKELMQSEFFFGEIPLVPPPYFGMLGAVRCLKEA